MFGFERRWTIESAELYYNYFKGKNIGSNLKNILESMNACWSANTISRDSIKEMLNKYDDEYFFSAFYYSYNGLQYDKQIDILETVVEWLKMRRSCLKNKKEIQFVLLISKLISKLNYNDRLKFIEKLSIPKFLCILEELKKNDNLTNVINIIEEKINIIRNEIIQNNIDLFDENNYLFRNYSYLGKDNIKDYNLKIINKNNFCLFLKEFISWSYSKDYSYFLNKKRLLDMLDESKLKEIRKEINFDLNFSEKMILAIFDKADFSKIDINPWEDEKDAIHLDYEFFFDISPKERE